MSKTYTVAQFAKAIPGSGGIISTVAKRVGCNWQTARSHIDKSPTLTRMWQDEREGLLDLAESVLMQSIQSGDTQDAKWYLARLGKNRGFADKVEQEITGADGEQLIIKIVDARD